MAEQTFRSANFYEREVDLSAPAVGGPTGVPAGVIGTSNKGPAFVPVTVASFNDFIEIFGDLDPKKFGPYAVNEFLKHRNALTFCRVLGAGANSTSAEIATTQTTGRVKNAGFKLEGSAAVGDTLGRHVGAVQFLCGRHTVSANESSGMPMFTDNDSYSPNVVHLVRGVVMMASTARMMVTAGAVGAVTAATPLDAVAVESNGKFKIIISSSLGATFANDELKAGVRIFTASFNPTSSDYFAKVLNTNPDKFYEAQHLLYADYAVDDEIATATYVGVLSGSARGSTTSGETATSLRAAYGAFDTRFTTPESTWFISQPFGATEYDLFKFEARDDGEYANQLYKITISNLKASLDDSYQYGTFTVLVRDMNDSDLNQNVLEQFPNCSLDPNSDNYVAKVIGDRKVAFNFDSTIDDDKRLIAYGKYANQSKYVRIVMNDSVESKVVPATTLPFGFRGLATLKTNDTFTDTANDYPRLVGSLGAGLGSALSGSLVPPLPFRYKVTKGEIPASPSWPGAPGSTEIASSLYTWGVKFERNTTPRNSNTIAEKNALLWSLTKFAGIEKLDVLVTGSSVDTQNNNKFTLAKVALAQTSIADLTSSVGTHMREAAYIRNGVYDRTQYTIPDATLGNRITLATILATDTAANFNKFAPYAKFTSFLHGGFDGCNILDRNSIRLNDKATSFDTGGCAESSYVPSGMSSNPSGAGKYNNAVYSYTTAIDIMTDPMVVNQNLLAIPGIKEPFVTDYATDKIREYGLGMYALDIPAYDEDSTRLFDDSTVRPDIDTTATQFDSRNIDNNYAATYFPDIFIDDTTNSRRVKVPASVGAMGALAFNDRVAYPWFAPAGFNRAALDFVTNVAVRLNVQDRDRLYDSRINPIATFPRLGFVIYGQKTLQVSKSALDRVNVRRLMLEIKRIIINIARKLIFEQNTPELRAQFVADSSLQLSMIQMQAGIEKFQVVCNETNNTKEDEDMNKLNGRVVVVPTRAIEFIAIDFVITNSGISFS